MNWRKTVKMKHLLTEKEDYESVQKSMTSIADVLDKDVCFQDFLLKKKFRKIPKGNDIINHLDYANKLLSMMYDFADENRIWLQ